MYINIYIYKYIYKYKYIYYKYIYIYIFIYTYIIYSPFKLIPLEFVQTILIAERFERCSVEKVFKMRPV